jgi:hypothetical protein
MVYHNINVNEKQLITQNKSSSRLDFCKLLFFGSLKGFILRNVIIVGALSDKIKSLKL